MEVIRRALVLFLVLIAGTAIEQALSVGPLPGRIIKFLVNYINGCKAYTTYINHTSSQHQFKTGILQGGLFLPTLFNIYTADIPPPRAPVQVMAYADEIEIYTHKHKCSQEIHTTILSLCRDKTKQSHTKIICTLFTPDPAEYKNILDFKINNTALTKVTHPKVLGLTLDPKLIYSTHIHNISVQAHKHYT